MAKINYKSGLYWRLSLAFLSVLVLLGMAYIFITAYSARQYYQETSQRLNAHVAEHMLLEVSPFVDGEVNEEALGKIMHSMMAVNPTLEVYLLSPEGNILSHVVLDKEVRLKNVDLSPVQEFLDCGGEHYVLGDDPRNPGEKAVFSATAVMEEGVLMGYVYMVLASAQYASITEALASSYFLRVGTGAFIITLIAAFGIGLTLISLLTRNLLRIQKEVKKFEEGDYQARIPVKGNGELADLSRTFNHMADTILRNMDELKEVDRLRRDLIANVSHDLRSPLSVIHGYIETMMIKDKQLTAEERRKYFEIILSSSDKLKKLVADLFELSRLEAKQVQMKKESFFLHELISDSARSYELMAKDKQIDIETNLDQNLPMVMADISMIGRVLQNLLENAIKYTPDEGSIKVSAMAEDDGIRVDIQNTGKGIPQENIPHIFDRYYKVESKDYGDRGTGLGLAIVKRILDLHQSNIEIKSVPQSYTSFSFKLNLAA